MLLRLNFVFRGACLEHVANVRLSDILYQPIANERERPFSVTRCHQLTVVCIGQTSQVSFYALAKRELAGGPLQPQANEITLPLLLSSHPYRLTLGASLHGELGF